jgi:pentatricopeptide repeat protein
MFQEGIIPNEVTYVSTLGICRDEATLLLGKHLHSCIVNDNYKRDVSVQNALISMYGNSGSVHDAETIFLGMAERNVVAWTSMMGVYAQNGKGLEALALYERMQQDRIQGDRTTLLCVLDACTSCLALGRGEQELHRFVECGSEIDSVITTSLLNLYGKCGCLDDAKTIFDRIHDRGLVSWTAMIALCAQHGECLVAFELFQQMQQREIFPDDLTFICMLYACSHAGLMQEAQHLFLCMERDYEITPSVFHYACIIDLLGRAGCLDEAETLVNNLSFQPTGELLMALLGACRYKGDVERGEHYAKKMFRADPANAAPYVILSNIYSAWS